MRKIRHLRSTALAVIAACGVGLASGQDSMGGMERPYINAGNIFGHGAWGNGNGTAIPLPGPRAQWGMYFDQAYDGGENLFGTGFWTAEYMVRRSETLSRQEDAGDASYNHGPLGDGYAGDGGHDYGSGEGGEYTGGVGHGGHGKGGYGKGGRDDGNDHGGKGDHKYGHMKGGHDKGGYDKGGYDKGSYDHGSHEKGGYDKGGYEHGGQDKGGHKYGHYGKGGYDKGGHDKGGYDKHQKEKVKVREVTRYIPYARREVVVGGRAYSDIVIVQQRQTETLQLGHVEVTETAERYVETFGAVCLTGKGDEVPAILTTDRGDDDSYQGEIFRCPANATLRVSYSTGAAEMAGQVDMEDGSSYADCDAGDALVRTASGNLVCAPKRSMSRQAERALASRYGSGETAVASRDRDDYDRGYDDREAEAVDLSGLQLSGGVGNSSGY